jgi:hypothetical protein
MDEMRSRYLQVPDCDLGVHPYHACTNSRSSALIPLSLCLGQLPPPAGTRSRRSHAATLPGGPVLSSCCRLLAERCDQRTTGTLLSACACFSFVSCLFCFLPLWNAHSVQHPASLLSHHPGLLGRYASELPDILELYRQLWFVTVRIASVLEPKQHVARRRFVFAMVPFRSVHVIRCTGIRGW